MQQQSSFLDLVFSYRIATILRLLVFTYGEVVGRYIGSPGFLGLHLFFAFPLAYLSYYLLICSCT
jgi:hypothetical protein